MLTLPQSWPRRYVVLALAAIIIFAALLRIPSHNWDQGQHLNPDEALVAAIIIDHIHLPAGTTLAQLLDPHNSPLNPRYSPPTHNYGLLFSYLGKLVTNGLKTLTGDQYFTTLDGTIQVGRVLAGLFDTLTVLLVFAIGARWRGSLVGLVAAALYALAVLPIQQAHFFIPESFLTFFITAVLLCAILFYQTRAARFLVLAGLCAGFAVATKIVGITALALPAVVIFAAWWQLGRARFQPRGLVVLVGLGVLTLGVALVAWFIGDAYAVLDLRDYLTRIAGEAAAQGGFPDLLHTQKYVGTLPVLYPWYEVLTLGINPIAGLLGLGGLILGFVRAIRKRSLLDALLLIGALAYFAPLIRAETRWVRYMMPLVPYLCIWASEFACWLGEMLAARRRSMRLALVPAGMLLLVTLLSALAFNAIYGTDNTRVRGSRWVYANVPGGSKIGMEGADYVLPLPLPEAAGISAPYQFPPFGLLADHPSAEESQVLYDYFSALDYFIINSVRNTRTAPVLPWRYPVQIRFYQLLFDGQLGYTLVDAELSYPTIFGLRLPDDGPLVDVSFTEYDHSPVWIFKRDHTLSRDEWDSLFAQAVAQPSIPTRYRPQ